MVECSGKDPSRGADSVAGATPRRAAAARKFLFLLVLFCSFAVYVAIREETVFDRQNELVVGPSFFGDTSRLPAALGGYADGGGVGEDDEVDVDGGGDTDADADADAARDNDQQGTAVERGSPGYLTATLPAPPSSSSFRRPTASRRARRRPRRPVARPAPPVPRRRRSPAVVEGAVPLPPELQLNVSSLDPGARLDVTLVTIGSYDRLAAVADTAVRWRGPMSVAVLLTDGKELAEWEALRDAPENRGRFRLTAVRWDEVPPDPEVEEARVGEDGASQQKLELSFPNNFLRNKALNAAATALVLVVDADLDPSPDLYDNLVGAQDLLRSKVLTGGGYLVVPALEVVVPGRDKYHTEESVVKSRALVASMNLRSADDAKRELLDGRLAGFHESMHFNGYGPTNVTRWATASEPFRVEYSMRYEPYGVVRRDVPRFQELYRGFGKNKSSWTFALATSFGYSFWVFDRGYLIHRDHLQARVPSARNENMWRRMIRKRMNGQDSGRTRGENNGTDGAVPS